jgi:Alr-MurF fusion protein
MAFKTGEIYEILRSQKNESVPDLLIKYLIFDTRKIIFPENSLFFALKGARRDGHSFIPEAYNKGIRAFVVENSFKDSGYRDSVFFHVYDTLLALQEIVKHHRGKFNIPVIGITGSNGKTILKEWISHILTPEFNVVKSPGSYNSQIGVPLSVWQLDKSTEVAIFEAGISRSGEMETLQGIIMPMIGVFTNLGDAHSDGFTDIKHKLSEKISLFSSCDRIICCGDDMEVVDALTKRYGKGKIISWTLLDNPDSALKVTKIENRNSAFLMSFSIYGDDKTINIPFSDKVSVRLILNAYLASIIAGAKHELIDKKMMELTYPKMRMELERGINECTLINDSYNSDIESISNALNYLKNLENNKSKTLIISDFFGLKRDSKETFILLKNMINESGLNKLILIGEEIGFLKEYLSLDLEINIYKDTTQFLFNIDNHIFYNENILIKGSRRFEFEKVFNKLSESLHKTQLIIDFEALDHNINVYRSLLDKNTKVMAVVKASGYGAGAIKLAEHFQKIGIDYLSVAFIDEGIELRKAGINLPVMIFNPDYDFLNEMVEYDLEPVIYSFHQFEKVLEKGIESFKFHIKLDTGMKRLGFEHEDIYKLTEYLEVHRNYKVVSVFSHLAASNDPEKDVFTIRQMESFSSMYENISGALGYYPLKHILNSSGIVRFPQFQFDMVRLGSGMHGVDISHLISDKLEAVHILKTMISQIKHIKPGEGIGYGLKDKSDKERIVAIIPVGYADGLLRQAGNGRYKVWINGSFVPVIADVNMDMSFIDITGIESVQPGDFVEVFGKNAKIEDLARAGNTIFYEIISRISIRIKRIYSAG